MVVPNGRLPATGFGGTYLTWRCDDCGETGHLAALHGTCVACGAGRESLYYATED